MNQFKSVYNSPFKSSYSHPIHTCLETIASNELWQKIIQRSKVNHYYTPMMVLTIVLKSGLFSTNIQLGVNHWGVKQLTHGSAIVFLKLNALARYARSGH